MDIAKMKWFKHDTDAASDAKVRKLLMRYGAVGYAVYFHCIELIAGDVSDNNVTFELEHDSEIIADDLRIRGNRNKSGSDTVEEIMSYIIDLGLFEVKNNTITCTKIAKRLDQSMTSNKSMRKVIASVKDDSDGYVYIISSEYGCKIGKSKDYDTRLRRFEVKLPFEFTIERIYKVRDRHYVELELHKMFNNKKLNGEWFKLSSNDIKNTDRYILSISDEIMIISDEIMQEENRTEENRREQNRREENIYTSESENEIAENSNQKITELYNSICTSLPRVQKMNDRRGRHINALTKEFTVDEIQTAFKKAESSDFLTGKKTEWQANFDWLINKNNLIKVIEGAYDNKQKKPAADINAGSSDWEGIRVL